VLPHDDNWAVAMGAGICEEVRDSSPAEWGSPENGRGSTGVAIPDRVPDKASQAGLPLRYHG